MGNSYDDRLAHPHLRIVELGIILGLTLFYKEIQTLIFDRDYAASLGAACLLIDRISFLFIVLAVVVGIAQ